MTEDEAKAWIAARFSSAACNRLERFGRMVVQENGRQNLIAPATEATIWSRHLLDSAQLVTWKGSARSWLDIGTGAGFPGMVVALIADLPVTLVEPRTRRVEFLTNAVASLGLAHVTIVRGRVEALPAAPYDVISARAVAPLESLLAMTTHVRTAATRLIFPRGRSGAGEIATARQRWQGMFHVEHSVTDPESLIVIADGVNT